MFLFFLKLLAKLPLRWLHAVGRFLGVVVYLLPGRYRQRIQKNAAQAGYSGADFARRAAAETGAMILETPKVWLEPATCLARCSTQDEHIVAAALAEQRGILYLTPHLGCFEITARALIKHGPITVMFRPPRQQFIEPAMQASRNMPGLHAVPASVRGIREFLKALRRNEAVGMLPDQVPSTGDGIWAPFFGKPAYTMTLAAKLALQANVPIVLTAGERLPKGQGWRIHYVRLTLPDDPTVENTVYAINEAMEHLIQRFPSQYLWSYNRYKIPPEAPAIPPSFTS
ncbi:lipid A biosynthesis lauroyl acyltransferase [Paenalcaligenes hominis]|uniref:Lipid A biosynthesis lauroyl acyltransferase n=1 Tax=Paenalcaligenes hominis TaxID=643674 RepID=A0A1U9K1J4_9BURK|nr:lysophospholipid acyltransferase family protein [Paenalcaligenes hominis]AQS51872.1 lipid A biosynthesis lauroyl acyltransferase [Paenalcaligenes hominis]